MKKIRIIFYIFLLILILLSSCSHSKKETLLEYMNRTPGKKLEDYSFDSGSSILSRISETPDFLLKTFMEWDNVDNYTSYLPTESELQIIEEYLSVLPPLHKKTIEEKLIGIYFINNLMGSGIADYVIDENNNIYTILIINPKTLKSSISEWISLRENSCFIQNTGSVDINVNCGDDYLGFLYILLHETSHIVDYIHYITPYTEPGIKEIKGDEILDKTELTSNVWNDYYIPVNRYNHNYRDNISYYGLNNGPHLKQSDISGIYKDLSNSPFVSLYGSLSWAEDFAELMTWYHITEKMGLPYEINLYKDNNLLSTYKPMNSPLVKSRINFIQKIYNLD